MDEYLTVAKRADSMPGMSYQHIDFTQLNVRKAINLLSPSPSSVIKNVLLKLSFTIYLNTKHIIYYWNITGRYIVKVTNSIIKFDFKKHVQNEHHTKD